MTYRDKLYLMIASTVLGETAAQKLTEAVLKLNQDTLEYARHNLHESGLTMRGTAALTKAEEEMGLEGNRHLQAKEAGDHGVC